MLVSLCLSTSFNKSNNKSISSDTKLQRINKWHLWRKSVNKWINGFCDRSSPIPTTCLRSCLRSRWNERGTFITECRVRKVLLTYLHSLKLSDLQLHLMCFHEMILFFLCLTDSDYENANRSADVDVELMAFQSIIGDDYKGQSFPCTYWETVI